MITSVFRPFTGFALTLCFSAAAMALSGGIVTTIYNNLYIGHGGLLLLPDGSLCGTTARGPGQGSVYQLLPPSAPSGPWTKRVLFTFSGADGSAPQSELTMDHAGNLYGSFTQGAGAGHHGGVFQLQRPAAAGGAWTEKILYVFKGAPDGSAPAGKMAFGSNGALYGTTTYGGTWDIGTVFELVPPAAAGGNWTESALYSFGSKRADGGAPLSGLIIDSHGNLYGANGGAIRRSLTGTVFRLSPPAGAGRRPDLRGNRCGTSPAGGGSGQLVTGGEGIRKAPRRVCVPGRVKRSALSGMAGEAGEFRTSRGAAARGTLPTCQEK